MSKLTAVEYGAIASCHCHTQCLDGWVNACIYRILCPLNLLMECLHIFSKQVGNDDFEERHKQPSLPFLSKLFHRGECNNLSWEVLP